MAEKKVLHHLLDKTIGMTDNEDALMCGRSARILGKRAIVHDPQNEEMAKACDDADKAGLFCPECKRGVAFYAKGCHRGEMIAKKMIMEDVITAMKQAHEVIGQSAVTHNNGSKMAH